jgi:hypothetical protein
MELNAIARFLENGEVEEEDGTLNEAAPPAAAVVLNDDDINRAMQEVENVVLNTLGFGGPISDVLFKILVVVYRSS